MRFFGEEAEKTWLKSEWVQFGLFILVLGANFGLAYYINGPAIPKGDSVSYYQAIQFIQGEDLGGEAIQRGIYNRLLAAPLTLVSASLVSYVTGSIYSGLLAVNIFFYLALAIGFFLLADELFNDRRITWLSSMLVVFNYDTIRFGFDYLTDMAGFAGFVLASWFAIRYFKRGERRDYWLAIALAAVGVLFREYGGLGLVSLVALILMTDKKAGRKFLEIALSIIMVGIVLGAYHLFFYLRFNYSYFDWYAFNLDVYALQPISTAAGYSLTLLLKVVGWVFLVGWPVLLLGLMRRIKMGMTLENRILLAMLPASVSFLVWPALTQRIAFVLVPLMALVAGFELSTWKSRMSLAAFLVIYVMVGYQTDYLMRVINFNF